jgi:beta-glucosidase
VLTQWGYVSGALDNVFGRGKRVLVSGDATKAQYYTTEYTSKKEVLAAANDLNEEINEEGITLLKNKDNALPVENGSKVSVFGKNSVNLVYGGSGSGGGNNENAKTIYDSLEKAGFDYNKTLKSFYESSSSGSGRPANLEIEAGVPSGMATGETPQSKYTDSVKQSYSKYNDLALIVYSRTSGEGNDLPRTMKTSFSDSATKVDGAMSADDHYLELDENEQDLLVAVCNAGFKKVVVIINCSTSMELGFLDNINDNDSTSKVDNIADKIDACLWIGGPGNTGIMALGRVLNGTVNPSGRTVDLYERDFTKDPTWQNFGNNNIAKGNEYLINGENSGYQFVEYEEGIYYGYRYYETRAVEETDNNWYENNVVFPFGYGLSYTNFEWTLKSTSIAEGEVLPANGTVDITVTVTNKGSVAGKDVVELYYTAPYYKNGIEKAHVILGDYVKTKTLASGESQDVTVSIDVQDMASYDWNDANNNGFKGYELEKGTYTLRLMKNSHDSVIDLNYKVNGEKTSETTGYTYRTDATTGNDVENRFDDVSEGLTSVMSRSNFAGTFPTTPTDKDRTITQAFIDKLEYKYEDTTDSPWYSDTMPTFASSTDGEVTIKLYDMINVDYDDDAKWDEFLSQFTARELANIIGTGCYSTAENTRMGKPLTTDVDGPVGFVNFMGDPAVYDTCVYASECVVAATWNKEMAYAMGEMVGNESIIGDEKGGGQSYSGIYAPAVNIHRSPFGGRNFEYYSEDPCLSGNMAANYIKAANSKGMYTQLKHFAVNDQETDRGTNGLCTWLTEQAMREIYFKPFEIAVKDGGSRGTMSSFNRLGTTWTGGDYRLLTEVLRNEWGFKGMVICDFNLGASYMDTEQMVRAGGDLNLAYDLKPSTTSKKLTTTQATVIKNCAKNILYVISHSNAMNGYAEGVVWGRAMRSWHLYIIIADGAVAAAVGVWGFFVIRKFLKKKDDIS